MKKIAIIGASYLQRPLVEKAIEKGIETHVFAWQEGNEVEDIAHFYYPISILDKDEILQECKRIGIDGISSIGSDIAMPTVNYIAEKLGLIGNSLEATLISTDKFEMRKALSNNGITCPKFAFYSEPNFKNNEKFAFPVIVKPTDRSGSRGVTKVLKPDNVNTAIEKALKNSIAGRVIIEEFIEGREFSVECISYNGKHYPITITDKVTTGAPYFVETAHHQPAQISELTKNKIFNEVVKTLGALKIQNGASHTEIFLLKNESLRIVESAGRMGGELIGSHITPISTGFDFVSATIDVCLGVFDIEKYKGNASNRFAGVYYVLPKSGEIVKINDKSNNFKEVVFSHPLMKAGDKVPEIIDGAGTRAGIIVYSSDTTDPIANPNDVLIFDTK